MNIKNNIVTYIAVFFLTGIIFTSCQKDLLNKSPLDRLSDATVWKDPALVQAYVNDQYHVLPSLDWYDKVRGLTLSSACDESIHPVSYTHLRAHETDSYLVCRLLLEKKKNKNNTNKKKKKKN